jgi:hypothetical protein
MTDIRKRKGAKGTTYQVRYPSKATKSGYAYKTFLTKKEAREFHESGEAKKTGLARSGGGIVTVADGVEKWLEVCEKEGRDRRDPVTDFTLKGYQYRARIINSFSWEKSLQELTAPDIVEFRSWLLGNYPRSMAHFVLSSFHSMILEMVFRGVLPHDVAARVSIRERSRYEEPVTIPSEREVMDLLAAADRLANSKNRQIQRTWERYRPILYLAADSGMRPQEYLAVADELLPQLEPRAEELAALAVQKLDQRGAREERDLRETLERQHERVREKLAKNEGAFLQLTLDFGDEEKRQLESDMRFWRIRLDQFERDLEREPQRIRAFYEVRAKRVEPVGLVYLWPETN